MQTLSVFPTRPLRVDAPKPKTVRRALGVIAAILILGGLLAGMVVWMGPSLLNDARIRQNPAIAEDGVVSNDAKCRNNLAVVTICDARLTATGPDGNALTTRVSYLFVDLHFDDYDVAVVQSADDPRLITTTLGLEYFWNRVICFAAAALLFAAGIIAMILGAIRLNRGERDAQALDGQRLTPVAVTIRSGQKVKKQITWRFTYPSGGREVKTHMVTPLDFMPFTLDAAGKRALAVTGPAGGVPFLLDAGLARIGVTDSERAALLDAQKRDQAAG